MFYIWFLLSSKIKDIFLQKQLLTIFGSVLATPLSQIERSCRCTHMKTCHRKSVHPHTLENLLVCIALSFNWRRFARFSFIWKLLSFYNFESSREKWSEFSLFILRFHVFKAREEKLPSSSGTCEEQMYYVRYWPGVSINFHLKVVPRVGREASVKATNALR